MKLRDKVAVITGGNSGIGLATAREFLANGAKVVIFGRSRQTLDQAVAGQGSDMLSVQGDVGNLGDLERLFTESAKRLGKIDILVANAGIAKFAPVDSLSEELFDELSGILFKGVFFTVQTRRVSRCGQAGPNGHVDIHRGQSSGAVAGTVAVS